MPGRASASNEVIDYRRSAGLPGVEVIDAHHSPREWRVLSPDPAVVMFRTWQGSVRNRGRVHTGEPGLAFCYMPGEVMVANPLAGPGSFSVLQLPSELVEQLLAEQQPSSVRFAWAGVMKPISQRLRQHLCQFFETFEPATSAMQVQSQLVELSEVMICELIQRARPLLQTASLATRAAARMRECLTEEGLNLDLDTLAKQVGLSPFRSAARIQEALWAAASCLPTLPTHHSRASHVDRGCAGSGRGRALRLRRSEPFQPPLQALQRRNAHCNTRELTAPSTQRRNGTLDRTNDPGVVIARSDR